MMNGLPGKMGYSCAEACVARGMTLADVALTGEPFAGTPTDDRIPKVDLVAGGSDEAEKRGAELAKKCRSIEERYSPEINQGCNQQSV